MTVRYGAVTLEWLGETTVRVAGQTGVVIYFDPAGDAVPDGTEPGDGDLVLVTRAERYDPAAIRRVAHEEAIVLVHEAVGAPDTDLTGELPDALPYEVERVRAHEDFVLGPLDLYTTPAHSVPDETHTRADGPPIHAEGEGCGYGVTIDGVTVFYPGDSDVLPAHEELYVDVFCPPIGGEETMDRDVESMDRDAAATIAVTMDAGLVLPIGYDPAGADVDAFVVDVASRGVPIVLDEGRR